MTPNGEHQIVGPGRSLMRVSIFCRCVTNVKTLIVGVGCRVHRTVCPRDSGGGDRKVWVCARGEVTLRGDTCGCGGV